MRFAETELKGAYIVEIESFEDGRGFFARSWCQKEFDKQGLNSNLTQCNISYNKKKGTLRGMHFQVSPYPETKLVRCTKGSIFDVIIDLREDSYTYLKWASVKLSEENRKMLYVPEGFAHGFQTLENDTEVFYQMSESFHPECARGVRYDDKVFGIKWPIQEMVISEKDKNFPDYVSTYNFESSNEEKQVIFWGASGQAKVLREALSYNKEYKLIALFDNDINIQSPFEDIPLYIGEEGFNQWYNNNHKQLYFAIAIGGDKGKVRVEIQRYLESKGLKPLTIIHPTAFTALNLTIGKGTQVLANASVCAGTQLSEGCIINTSSSVDHECYIGEGVHICPGAHVAGCVKIEKNVMIGTGAVILPRLVIGEGAIIGAGAVVTKNVEPYSVMIGNPARALKRLEAK